MLIRQGDDDALRRLRDHPIAPVRLADPPSATLPPLPLIPFLTITEFPSSPLAHPATSSQAFSLPAVRGCTYQNTAANLEQVNRFTLFVSGDETVGAICQCVCVYYTRSSSNRKVFFFYVPRLPIDKLLAL